MTLMSEEIDARKINSSKQSAEYRLGANDAYSKILTMMTQAMVADSKEKSEKINKQLTDDKNNNSEWKN